MRSVCLMLALVVMSQPTLSRAAEKKENIDKKTAELLKKVGVLYKDAKSMQADIAINTKITDEDDKDKNREIKMKATVAFQRPNLFALRAKMPNDAKSGLEIVFDGKNAVVFRKRSMEYTEGKPPSDLAGVGRQMMPFGDINTGMLFQNVLAEDPEEQLLEGVTKGEYVGVEKVEGKEAHHMKFEQDEFKWELWVAAEGQPFVVKASTTRENESAKRVTLETYTNWKLNSELPKDTFEFKPPEDAKKVKMFTPPGGKDG